MPDMDGETLARTIKKDPHLKHTLLVMLSSRGRRGDAAQMSEAGFAAYLTKPARQSTLLGALRMVVGNSRNSAASSTLVTRHSLAEASVPGRAQVVVPHAAKTPRILVVEDNAVNQLVAMRMLQRQGCETDIAADGQKALEMIGACPYDLVFMDCQMPVMDGYEATAEIRRTETPGRRLPIVAMTANAIQGDRERCIESGMDDYISKPVNKGEIAAILKRFLTAEPTQPAEPGPPMNKRDIANSLAAEPQHARFTNLR
jgi:two-component system, sensor histidine kinase and response regulator